MHFLHTGQPLDNLNVSPWQLTILLNLTCSNNPAIFPLSYTHHPGYGLSLMQHHLPSYWITKFGRLVSPPSLVSLWRPSVSRPSLLEQRLLGSLLQTTRSQVRLSSLWTFVCFRLVSDILLSLFLQNGRIKEVRFFSKVCLKLRNF